MDPFAPEATTRPEAHAVLAEVTCSWGEADEPTTAVIVHAAPDMLVLEADDVRHTLPPLGTEMHVVGDQENFRGRLAEQGRGGRFLISIGTRPVRRALRLKVSLPGTLRSAALDRQLAVEIVDLTTGGCRVRGIELPVGTAVSLDFIPPGREQSVSVRAVVAHGTHKAARPWIGLAFRLVAMRGGR